MSGSASSGRVSIEDAVEIAVQHHNAGRLGEAEQVYRQILQAVPDQPVVLHLLGVLTHQTGNSGDAIDLIRRALAREPDYVEAHNNLGLALAAAGRLGEAVDSYREAIARAPDYGEAHRNLGVALRMQGDRSAAVESYRRALEIDPDSAAAHRDLGALLRRMGQQEEGVTHLRRAVALRPDDAVAHNLLGMAMRAQGDSDEAIAHYEVALAVEPDYVEVLCNLGNVLRDLDRPAEAAERYRTAAALQPDYAPAHLGLGLSLHRQGQLAAAKDAYEAGVALGPPVDIAHVALRRVRIALGDLTPNRDVAADQRQYEAAHPGLRVWNRPVEPGLIDYLYQLDVIRPEEEMQSGLVKDRYSAGIRRGNMAFSGDYAFLERDAPVVRALKRDLLAELSAQLHAEIYVGDSFFNIYHAGSEARYHDHIQDSDKRLGLEPQKFSLVYYVAVGDKTAAEPGVLKLYDPDHTVDPREGDVVLFPSSSRHSANYSGATDRIIIGVNCYTY